MNPEISEEITLQTPDFPDGYDSSTHEWVLWTMDIAPALALATHSPLLCYGQVKDICDGLGVTLPKILEEGDDPSISMYVEKKYLLPEHLDQVLKRVRVESSSMEMDPDACALMAQFGIRWITLWHPDYSEYNFPGGGSLQDHFQPTLDGVEAAITNYTEITLAHIASFSGTRTSIETISFFPQRVENCGDRVRIWGVTELGGNVLVDGVTFDESAHIDRGNLYIQILTQKQ